MAPERTLSETSPLLGNGNGTASTGAIDLPHEESAEHRNDVDEQSKEPFKDAQKQLKYIIPAISLGIFLSAADQTIIMASYGQIGSDLKALNLTSWIATSYFLTLTSFQPLYGKLSDIFGRKGCLLFAYAIFGTGCLFCGLAQNIYQLIAARVFQGIGGGGMTTVVSILMSDIVPLRDRGLWQGIINIIWATGSGMGAPLGGILADYIGWRWAFLAQFPLCIVAFIAVSLMLKLPARENVHWKDKLRRIDFLGAIVLVGAVLGFLVGLDRGSNVSWTMPLTVISWGSRWSSLFSSSWSKSTSRLSLSHRVISSSIAHFSPAIVATSSASEAVDGVSATIAGVRLLPSILTGVSGSLFAGAIMRWSGKYYWLTIASYTSLTAGCFLIYLSSGGATTSLIAMIIGMCMSSFGNGIGVTTTLIGLISNATVEDQAVVTACSYLFRSLGSVIGLSLSSTVVQQLLREQLRIDLHDSKNIDEIVAGVRESLDYIKRLDPDIANIVRHCYGWSTNKGFAFLTGVVFFALFSAFFIKEAKLNR
ncbi:uncharacterized protein N7483_008931 [Penicillium malachiteum]|uniref:uncharacterized protein n=1 Tax=Penicillium malachiteum TaxID=1324776 RepID=UPI002548519A|nr:uncharacterized protein N7483_008931 [Penicillium malachiteum]KAJ5720997.1 hypothetical protein N7483_008931 [Penicillium malachiteum]